MNSEHTRSAKSDFISSVIFCMLSMVIFFLSLAMPKYVEWGLYATPSLAPMVFSIILFICSVIMLVRSIVLKGYRITISGGKVKDFLKSPVFRHFVVAFVLVYLYYAFFSIIHFAVLSSLYLFLNIFYYRSTTWWRNLIISIGFSVGIYVLFNYVFFIPLP